MNFWDTVVAITIGIGLAEGIKIYVLSFFTDHLNRNKEIRKIGTRVQKFLVKLRNEDFDSPVSKEQREVLLLDVMRLEADEYKEFTQDIMRLVNLPVLLSIHGKNAEKGQSTWKEYVADKNALYDLTERLNKACNYYRRYPLIRLNKPWKWFCGLSKNILAKVRMGH